MAFPGQNKGNKNAALKAGEIGRIYWTQSLSGELLLQFMRYYDIDTSLPEKDLQKAVSMQAKKVFKQVIQSQLKERGGISDET